MGRSRWTPGKDGHVAVTACNEDIARTVHPTLPEAVREVAPGVAKRSLNI